MTLDFGLILDVVIAVLLVVTILYCWRLSKKLNQLQLGKQEFDAFIRNFNTAIVQAGQSVETLKEVSSDTDTKLRTNIEKARFLANDLSFLMSKGENVADVLEHRIAESRQSDRLVQPTPAKGIGLLAANKAKAAHQPSEIMKRPSEQQAQVKRTQPQGHFNTLTESAPAPKTPTPAKPQPQAAATTGPDMTPSKKMALDSVLAQIASRKQTPAGTARPIDQTFDRRRVGESLKKLDS